MLITKTRLKEIIKEEISRGLEEDATQKDVQRVGDKLGKVPGLANYFSRVDTPQELVEMLELIVSFLPEKFKASHVRSAMSTVVRDMQQKEKQPTATPDAEPAPDATQQGTPPEQV